MENDWFEGHLAISWQHPTTNIESDMVCVKLSEITK